MKRVLPLPAAGTTAEKRKSPAGPVAWTAAATAAGSADCANVTETRSNCPGPGAAEAGRDDGGQRRGRGGRRHRGRTAGGTAGTAAGAPTSLATFNWPPVAVLPTSPGSTSIDWRRAARTCRELRFRVLVPDERQRPATMGAASDVPEDGRAPAGRGGHDVVRRRGEQHRPRTVLL